MLPKVGEKYSANGPLIARHSGVLTDSTWIVACVDGNCISLTLYAGNGSGYTKLTIAKAFFGLNFVKVEELFPPDRSTAYRIEKHYYPDVNERDKQILPV